MSDCEDILWALQRQARSIEEVLADARLVWRDSNARAAEQKFLQPRAIAEAAVLAAVGVQHRNLSSAANELLRADEQHRVASAESAQVNQSCGEADSAARSALGEADAARAQAQQADQLAGSARSFVGQANSAGAG